VCWDILLWNFESRGRHLSFKEFYYIFFFQVLSKFQCHVQCTVKYYKIPRFLTFS
jgi:hypothetical protein